MELIKKSDAIRAVLHNDGQSAVAAVQEIKAVNAESLVMCGDCDLYNDLKEEHLELIRRLPKAFREPSAYRYCPYCGEYGIHLRCGGSEFNVRGIHVKCDEIVAECSSCGQEIYIPSINDWNCENREYAYQVAKAERKDGDGCGSD